MSEIFKVQIELTTTTKPEDRRALVYNHCKRKMFQLPQNDVIEHFSDDEYKIFVRGSWDGKKFTIVKKIEPRGW